MAAAAVLLLVCMQGAACGQNNYYRDVIAQHPEYIRGTHCVYPEELVTPAAPVPEGYEPFYMYYHARHGSRRENRIDMTALDELRKADAAGGLTEKGRKVLADVELYCADLKDRGGDLSPVGVRQHKRIAKRMYANYPALFADSTRIDARSTMYFRTAFSMDACCESLKEENPHLRIVRDASKAYHSEFLHQSKESDEFVSHDGKWYAEQYRPYRKSVQEKPTHLLATLFTPKAQKGIADPQKFASNLAKMGDMSQNLDLDLHILDVFSVDELYGMWRHYSYNSCVFYGGCPVSHEIRTAAAKPLLKNIVAHCEEGIAKGEKSATMRFSHESNLGPLACLLKLKGAWSDSTDPDIINTQWDTRFAAPMAVNIQIVLFKNAHGDVIATVRYNERDVELPVRTVFGGKYYPWDEMKAFFNSLL